MVVRIEVAHDQSIAPKIPLKERDKRWGETPGAGGSGGDIDVDNSNVYLIYCDDDTLMFSGIVAVEEEVGTERFVWGVLPDEEGETPSPIRGGAVPGNKSVSPEENRVGVRGKFGFLEANHPDLVGD